MAAVNEELALVPERLQVDLVNRQVFEILPLTSNLKDNISFRILNNINKHYIDVNNIFIELTLKLTKSDGTNISKLKLKLVLLTIFSTPCFKMWKSSLTRKM